MGQTKYYLVLKQGSESSSFSHCCRKGFKVKGLSKRFDIVVFDKKGNIIILIECKSPKIKLNQKSIDQLVIYNLELNASYLMLSNGLKHIFIKYQNGNFEIIDDIPVYSKL